MFSHTQKRITGCRMGFLAFASVLSACQAQTVVAADSDDPASLQMVYFEVSIAVSGDGTDTRILDQFQLTTLAGSKGRLQVGQQVAVPTGVTNFPGNRVTSRSYEKQQVGTIVEVKAQVIGEQIAVDLRLEKSWLESPMSESEEDIASVYTTFNMTLESTLALSDGKTQMLKARVTGAPGGQREAVISITAGTKQPSAVRPAARKPEPPKMIQSRRSIDKPARTILDRLPSPRATEEHEMQGGQSNGDKPKPNKSKVDRPVSPTPSAVGRMFELIDKNKDGIISSPEWTMNGLARTIASRGVKYSEKMDREQFAEAVAKMKKGFSKDRDPKQKSDSPRS